MAIRGFQANISSEKNHEFCSNICQCALIRKTIFFGSRDNADITDRRKESQIKKSESKTTAEDTDTHLLSGFIVLSNKCQQLRIVAAGKRNRNRIRTLKWKGNPGWSPTGFFAKYIMDE